jgi:hypothetical protein
MAISNHETVVLISIFAVVIGIIMYMFRQQQKNDDKFNDISSELVETSRAKRRALREQNALDSVNRILGPSLSSTTPKEPVFRYEQDRVSAVKASISKAEGGGTALGPNTPRLLGSTPGTSPAHESPRTKAEDMLNLEDHIQAVMGNESRFPVNVDCRPDAGGKIQCSVRFPSSVPTATIIPKKRGVSSVPMSVTEETSTTAGTTSSTPAIETTPGTTHDDQTTHDDDQTPNGDVSRTASNQQDQWTPDRIMALAAVQHALKQGTVNTTANTTATTQESHDMHNMAQTTPTVSNGELYNVRRGDVVVSAPQTNGGSQSNVPQTNSFQHRGTHYQPKNNYGGGQTSYERGQTAHQQQQGPAYQQQGPAYTYQQQQEPAYTYQQQQEPAYTYQQQQGPAYTYQQQQAPTYRQQQGPSGELCQQFQQHEPHKRKMPSHQGNPRVLDDAPLNERGASDREVMQYHRRGAFVPAAKEVPSWWASKTKPMAAPTTTISIK